MLELEKTENASPARALAAGWRKLVNCSGNPGFFKRNAPATRGRFVFHGRIFDLARLGFFVRSLFDDGKDLLKIPPVVPFVVAALEFDVEDFPSSKRDQGRHFERYALEGSKAPESSGGRRIRSVEGFEMFVSERVGGEGGHTVVGFLLGNLLVRTGLTS